MEGVKKIKTTTIGTEGVGRTCLAIQFVFGYFEERTDPTIENSYKKIIQVDDEDYQLEIEDSAAYFIEWSSQSNFAIRYASSLIIVYSVTSRESFDNVRAIHNHIEREFQLSRRRVPLLLVGNKCDLCDERCVSTKEGEELARSFQCTFMEASAKDHTNVDQVFYQMIREMKEQDQQQRSPSAVAPVPPSPKPKTCCLL